MSGTYAHAFNEQPMGWLVKNYGIQQLDFSHLIQLYFWDLTFLSDHLAKMSRQESRTMLIWPEPSDSQLDLKPIPTS